MKKRIVFGSIIALIGIAAWFILDPKPPHPNQVVIFEARNILTLDASTPYAEVVAVRKGEIIGLGTRADLYAQYPKAKRDTQFKDNIIIPGLIDPHVHMILGAMVYGLDFVPPWDMETPSGVVKGLPDRESFLQAVAAFAQNGDKPLILYGYHNLVQGDLIRQDLDRISPTRPLFIWHYSGHDFYLNSAAIELAELTPALADTYHGIGLDENGALNGRIYEDAIPPLYETIGPMLIAPAHINKGWNGYERIFTRYGITTVAEMAYGIFGRPLEDIYRFMHYRSDDSYRLYLIPEHRAFDQKYGEAAVDKMLKLSAKTKARAPVLAQVKLFSDGAFYSQTMKMALPGYIGGQSEGTDGLWVTPPDQLPDLIRRYWDAGLDIHIHSNGDASQDSVLAALGAQDSGRAGQRLIVEHGGIFNQDQLLRAAELGIGISAASHYVHYMGENYKESIGDKAEQITPLRSAADLGVHVTMHSDAPLAPPHPLKAAGVHMTRLTRQGTVGNADERLSPEQALRAITIEAAWSLGLEDKLGSISIGKWADFTILGENPLETPGEAWGDIPIYGVVVDGRVDRISQEG